MDDLRAKIERELDEMMMGAENYFGHVNPKRAGHIRCALDRIMKHVPQPPVWKTIEGEMKGKFLVTNNIKATDANGDMSHIWICNGVRVDEDGRYCALPASQWDMVINLSHYAEIPRD